MDLIKPYFDVGLVTADASKARSFYCGVLGLRELASRSLGEGVLQHRFRAELPNPPRIPEAGVAAANGYRLMALVVDDLDETSRRIRGTGVVVVESPDVAGGSRSCFTTDPDGNTLELIEPSKARANDPDRVRIGLTVSNLDLARHFYREVLGLREEKGVGIPGNFGGYAF